MCSMKKKSIYKLQILNVTRQAKADHVSTLIYLINTNLKYSITHNFPVPGSSRIKFTHADCFQLDPPFQFDSNHSYGTRWLPHFCNIFRYSTSFVQRFIRS